MEIFAVESFPGHIKIEYLDGSSEEIENFIYERKNSDGDTVEQRPVLPADTNRLTSLAASFEAALPPITSSIVEVEIIGSSIEISYADGSKEKVANGIYERKDSANETIVERPATPTDTNRLNDLADGFNAPNSPNDDGTPDQGPGDAPGTPTDDGPDDSPTQIGETENGTNGPDKIETGSGDDSVSGNDGDDRIRTREGDDTINGGAGNDRLRGDEGDDEMQGWSGNDRMRGDEGNDSMMGGSGDDRMRGGLGNDTMSGGFGDDRMRGDEGNDSIDGNDGDDRLVGDLGSDTLNGGNGEDIYKGGLGADRFIFEADGAEDIIKDFENGIDVIDLRSYGFTSVTEVLNAASEQGGDTYIDLGGGDVIKLDDFSVSLISADDFLI